MDQVFDPSSWIGIGTFEQNTSILLTANFWVHKIEVYKQFILQPSGVRSLSSHQHQHCTTGNKNSPSSYHTLKWSHTGEIHRFVPYHVLNAPYDLVCLAGEENSSSVLGTEKRAHWRSFLSRSDHKLSISGSRYQILQQSQVAVLGIGRGASYQK